MSSNGSCPSVYDLPQCVIERSYLRPGPGVTFMPWLYAVVFTLSHFALLWARIEKWDKTRYLSLAMALANLLLTLFAYVSTGLSAETVYVWLPVTLGGEVGALMQLHAVLYKDQGVRIAEIPGVKEVIGWIFGGRKRVLRGGRLNSRTELQPLMPLDTMGK